MRSIFPINDIDEVFIHLLPLDDLHTLAQVNKYYNKASNNDILMKEYKIYLTKRYLCHLQFLEICKLGLLNLAKWWRYKYNPSIHDNNDNIFRWSCSNGHIDVAKWLYSLGGINIHVYDDYVFRESCFAGRLDLAKWLYSIGANIHAHNDQAFKHNKGEVKEWLQTLITKN